VLLACRSCQKAETSWVQDDKIGTASPFPTTSGGLDCAWNNYCDTYAAFVGIRWDPSDIPVRNQPKDMIHISTQ